MRTLLILAIMLLPLAAAAQSSEDERRQACTGDAFRLCALDIPDRGKIRACLAAHRDDLSEDCRAVMEGRRPKTRG